MRDLKRHAKPDPHKPYNDIAKHHKLIISYILGGNSYVDIANVLKVKYTRLYAYCYKHGL